MIYRLQFAFKNEQDEWKVDLRRFDSPHPIPIHAVGDVVELFGVGRLRISEVQYSYAADNDPLESELCITLRCAAEPEVIS